MLLPITVFAIHDYAERFVVEYRDRLSGEESMVLYHDERDMLRFGGDHPRTIGHHVFMIGVGKPKKPPIKNYKIGDRFDYPDKEGIWYTVTVVNQTTLTVTVRFEGWSPVWDQIVSKKENNLCPLHSFTIPWRESIRVHDTLECFKDGKWFPIIVNDIFYDTIHFYVVSDGGVDESHVGMESRYSSRLCPFGVHVRPYTYKQQSCFLNQTDSPYVFQARRVERNNWEITM